MKTYKLLLLPGDGIGPEVMAKSPVSSPGSTQRSRAIETEADSSAAAPMTPMGSDSEAALERALAPPTRHARRGGRPEMGWRSPTISRPRQGWLACARTSSSSPISAPPICYSALPTLPR